MIDTTFVASHLYRHKTSGKDQTMQHETQIGTVGSTKEAQQINCTDEEARILLRKDLTRPEVVKTRGPTRKVLDFLILNPGAALFFGTIGYWSFGLLAIGVAQNGVYAGHLYSTGFHPLDGIINNPLVMMALSVVLLVIAASSENRDRPSLFKGLGVMVVLISFVVALMGTMLTGAILFIGFAISQGEIVGGGALEMFLVPAGYLLFVKMTALR